MSNENKSPNLSTQFRVVMEDFEEASFQSCDGLEAEVEVLYHAEGGRGLGPRAVRGTPKISKLTFAKGTIHSKGGKKTILDWLTEVMDYSKPLKRQMLTIQLLDAQKNPVRTWKVKDAWPCRWTGPLLSLDSSGLTVEHLVFAHEGISW
jgi:phage tail-like protein